MRNDILKLFGVLAVLASRITMEIIIFIGIQATGKSTFYKDHFFDTHVRINLDMLKTNNREKLLISACLEGKQPFVIDKINHTIKSREKYITLAKENKFKAIAYYFQSKVADSIVRNDKRNNEQKIPEIAIKGTYNKLELPNYSEGFDKIFYVKINENKFIIEEWNETEHG